MRSGADGQDQADGMSAFRKGLHATQATGGLHGLNGRQLFFVVFEPPGGVEESIERKSNRRETIEKVQHGSQITRRRRL